MTTGASRRSAWIVAGVFLAAFLLLTPLGRFSERIPHERHTGYYSLIDLDISDEGGHYVYMPSLWFDGDLDFSNNWKMNVQAFTCTETGVARNYWTIGAALLWFPFFLLGRVVSSLYATSGLSMDPDGYGFPELALTGLGTVVYGFLGVLCLVQVLRRVTTERAALWIALVAYFSSLVPFYAFVQTRMAHGLETALNAFLLLAAFRAHEAPEARNRWLALGVASGFAAIVRLNGPMTLVYVAPLFWRRLFPEGFARTWPDGAGWRRLARAAVPWALAFVPIYATQALASWTFFGRPFGPSGDAAYSTDNVLSAEGLGRLTDLGAWLEIVAGPRFGFAWMMPLAVPALWGLWTMARAGTTLAQAGLAHIGLLLLMIVMFGHWGSGYGYRYLAAAIPILATGLAAFHARLVGKRLFAIAAAAAVFWQYVQVLQHKTWLSHDDPEHTWNAFSNLPDLLGSPADLLRSSAWLPLFVRGGWTLDGPEAKFFLIGIPMTLILLLATGVLAWDRLARGNGPLVDRAAPWATGLLMVAIAPVLRIGLSPPYKEGHALYATLVGKIAAARAAPPIYRHPLGELIPRARELGKRLGREQPEIDLLYAEELIRLVRRTDAQAVLDELQERHPQYAEAARRLLASDPTR